MGAGASIIWFQWVPSKANIADLPSRKEYEMLRRFGAERRSMILPDFEMWDEPIRSVVRRAMAGGGVE